MYVYIYIYIYTFSPFKKKKVNKQIIYIYIYIYWFFTSQVVRCAAYSWFQVAGALDMGLRTSASGRGPKMAIEESKQTVDVADRIPDLGVSVTL